MAEINPKTLKRLKLIFLDVDGTLLKDDASICPETIKIVHQLQNLGVQFSLASGRLHSALIAFADQLNISIPIVSLDGSLIKSHKDDLVIFESFVKEKYVLQAVAFADRFLINIALCHADAIYYNERNSAVPQILDKYGARYEEVTELSDFCDETLEVVFAGDNRNSFDFIYKRLSFPYAYGLNTSFFKSQRKEGLYYLEIRKKGSSKGKGFLRLLKYLKLSPKDAAVVGDWYNDISLFHPKAVKVAVANAVPELKRLADIVTEKTNDENGVAEFLEMVLRAKKD